jgi:hypothetical protein
VIDKVNHADDSKKMDVDDNDKSTVDATSDAQIVRDETLSTVPKTTTIEQDARKLSSTDINEKDVKAAAASALASAAVKAKVCCRTMRPLT